MSYLGVSLLCVERVIDHHDLIAIDVVDNMDRSGITQDFYFVCFATFTMAYISIRYLSLYASIIGT